MVEGDLWRYAHTDLGDFYRNDLTLRQLYVRVWSLPYESETWATWRAERDKAEGRREVSEVEDLLAPFQPKEG